MTAAPRYRTYSEYLQRTYGETVYRVAVDAGFSCPHRGPDRAAGGCTFCSEDGARAPYLGAPPAPFPPAGSPTALTLVRRQVERGREFLARRYGARAFMLYFQAFSGTFAAVDALEATYDAGLDAGDFVELVVSTRPDCVDARRADLLAAYRRTDRAVWVELGLQSACERTLRRVHRGHGRDAFLAAFALLRERGLMIAPHLIFGLPGEGWDEIRQTVDLVAGLRPDGIKIHNLHVPQGTALAREVRAGEIPVLSAERHLEYVIRALEVLPAETIVIRLTCDTPGSRKGLPRRFADKASFLRRLAAELTEGDTWQGRLLGAPRPPSV
jgi:uncharacterized protein